MLAAAWKYRMVIAAVAAAIALIAAYYFVDGAGFERGYEKRIADEAARNEERTNAANRASDAARKCALDPACRMQSDQWERK